MNEVASPRSGSSKINALLIFVALILGAALAAAYLLLVVVPREAAETVTKTAEGGADVFVDLVGNLRDELGFTPKVVVDTRVISEETRDALELVTIERQMVVRHLYEHTVLGSTKQIAVEGEFLVKAGYDLEEELTLEILTEPGLLPKIRVRVGDPVLISLEQLDVRIEETDGWWNRIENSDREAVHNELGRMARLQALRSGLLQEAEASLRRRVESAVLAGFVEVDWTQPIRLPDEE